MLLPAGDIFSESLFTSSSSSSRLGGLSSYCDLIASGEAANREQPVRRFKSSLLGGEIPYGSNSSKILTQAQRKEYPPTPVVPNNAATTVYEPNNTPDTTEDEIILKEPTSPLPEQNLIHLSQQKVREDPTEPECEPAVVRCSVIQRISSVSSLSSTSPALATTSSTPPPPPPAAIAIRKESKPTAINPLVLHHNQMAVYQRLHQQVLLNTPHLVAEPEQEHPIDYHIPKKRDYVNNKCKDSDQELIGSEEDEDKRIKKFETMDEREARVHQARKAYFARQLLSHIRRLPSGKVNGILQAAAGHGRSSSNNSGSQSTGSSGGQSQSNASGGSINFNGGSAGCGTGSSLGGGVGGAGAGGNGRDNRSNYGPNSPPTGSLPPFYESLKGGANGGLNAYNAQNGMNGNAFNNYLSSLAQMECDANGDLTSIGGYPNSPQDSNAKQYSELQNAYLQNGMILKDEIDLDYDGKIDTLSLSGNLMPNYNDSYSDAMMVDLSNAVDPLQLTATLTFSTPTDHALLECLTDAVDLSQFLQRLPNDDNDLDITSTPSLTPDSGSAGEHHHQQHQNLDSFQDHLIGGRHNNSGFHNERHHYFKSSPPSSTSSYENPPSYQTAREHNSNNIINNTMHNSILQQQHHQHQHSQNGMSSYDLDSHNSNLSLPSPDGHYDNLSSPQHTQHNMNGELQPPSASTTPSPTSIASTIQNVSKVCKVKASSFKLRHVLASKLPINGDHKKAHVNPRVSDSSLF